MLVPIRLRQKTIISKLLSTITFEGSLKNVSVNLVCYFINIHRCIVYIVHMII